MSLGSGLGSLGNMPAQRYTSGSDTGAQPVVTVADALANVASSRSTGSHAAVPPASAARSTSTDVVTTGSVPVVTVGDALKTPRGSVTFRLVIDTGDTHVEVSGTQAPAQASALLALHAKLLTGGSGS